MDDSSPPPPPTTVRRNPHRRARNTPFVPTSLSHFNAAGVAATLQPFSLEEAPEAVPLPPLPSSSPSPAKPSGSTTSNLKVFLRIRPTEIKPQPRTRAKANNPNPRSRAKGSPQKAKKKKTEVCLTVNGPESVTLTIPKSKLVDSKRGNKSEIYDGFSFVFPPESLQTDVYDKVMNPLVNDFMGGKSALLVAMGPTGSGKTHTMFGSNREPGLVPLALKKIFCNGEKNLSQPRSFYLAMLEIYSVSGKGEKMIDLLSDGSELTLVQSTIKGLEEVPVSDLEGAERLVARGILKRSTAATDANSQSSRSQCIITIRRANDIFNDMSFGNGVFVIADLAGAERDKKTGNMGTRQGESHFINNTSMVFGLCLRSLLEHQKNPKRPLEMHYKNSLLTRYLKEYLEGKKRMTLILTVKPAEDDYVDTSFVLRQAAPYMKIKYTNIEEANAPPPVQKRNYVALAQQGYKKKRKVDGEICVDSTVAVQISEEVNAEKLEVVQATEDPIIQNVAPTVDTTASNGDLHAELQQAKRNEVIMTQFARVFWNNLKLYKGKLLKSENKVHSMRAIIIEKDRRIMELEGELAKVLSCQKQSEQVISFLDENVAGNNDSVSVVSMPDSMLASSNSATASSSILLENSLLSDCEQATVPSIKKQHEDKHSENIKDEVEERHCISFAAEPECFPCRKVAGDPLEIACPENNTDEGQVPSTENEIQSSVELIKAELPIVADTSPSSLLETRSSIKFTSQHGDSSGCGFAEGPDGKLILRSEGLTALSSEVSDASTSIVLGQIDLLSDFEQATVLSDDKKVDKKSEDLEEEEEKNDTCNYVTEKQFGPKFAEGDPLQMVCPDSDTDEGNFPYTENEIQCSTQLHEIILQFTCQSASLLGDGFAEVSEEKVLSFRGSTENNYGDIDPLQMVCPASDIVEAQMLALENEPKSCTDEFTSACCSGGGFAKESNAEGDCSEGSTEEPKNDILEQIVAETAPANGISLLKLSQTIRQAEVVVNYEMHDECKSPNIIEKEENYSCTNDLERHEFLPGQILRDDDVLQKVCPDSDDEEEMLSVEKTIQFNVHRIEAKTSDNASFSPLLTDVKRQSSEFVRQRKSSSGSSFADGSEARIALSFEGSTGEAGDNASDQRAATIDASSSTSLRSQEIFEDSEFNQVTSSSFKESKRELENKKAASCEELRKETRHDPVKGNCDALVNIEPKKGPEELPFTSLDRDGKSSIERRKENQPIKSLIEVIGKENCSYPAKPFIARKPKRRLRPASSMLLKEFTSPDMDPDIPKDSRKTSAGEATRSEGSMTLIQLLTGPIREKSI